MSYAHRGGFQHTLANSHASEESVRGIGFRRFGRHFGYPSYARGIITVDKNVLVPEAGGN